jgi:uncharacterized protein with NRDE domain
MCTLTWQHHDAGYTVLFNRDELNTRQQAIPPSVETIDGVKVISPKDPDANGTWIATNEFGVTTCLLNAYPEGFKIDRTGKRSRGLLVVELGIVANPKQLDAVLSSQTWSSYLPFSCFVFFPDQKVRNFFWNGLKLADREVNDDELPQSGSSFKNAEVVAERVRVFGDMVSREHASTEKRMKQLLDFHAYHDPKKGAYSVNMKRDDAQTVSFSRIDVNESSVRFSYREKLDDGVSFDSETEQSIEID